jgi:hypothetical protein
MDMRSLPFYILATLTVAIMILLVPRLIGGGQSSQPLPQAEAGLRGELTIEDIRAQDGLPAYWLGETYRGLPVVKVEHVWDPGSPDGIVPPEEHVGIIYASCKPGHPAGGGSAEGYCAEGEDPTYVSVNTEWLCLRPPSLLARGARKGPPVEVRGAQAQRTTSGNTRFHFGNSTVTIFASESEEVAMEAFDHLVGINAPGLKSAPDAGSRLPPPVSEEECSNFVLPTPPPTPTWTARPTETATPEPTASEQPTNIASPGATGTPTPGGS